MNAPIVTIFGGSGFVGRYVARRMAKRGWRVRVAVRRPNEALFVRPYGDVGQVEPVQANIRDDASTRRAMQGATAVINCVGILQENSRQSFAGVQVEGAARIARLAAECGAERLVHISAIGADTGSDSAYARTKAEGEAAVKAAFPTVTILRPSVIFGPEDEFFNRFAGMARLSPILPLVGAETKFQPVYVDNVAEAACRAAAGEAAPGVFELGGPHVYSFTELMEMMLAETRRRRLLLPVPFFVARIIAGLLDLGQTLSFGLIDNRVLTRDQVRLLRHDNVVAEGASGLAELGVAPISVGSVIGEYLYSYRPKGQYDAITESAARLKG
ncbi:complex I NDUFA9 subunit family protein [Pikeienuella piscinae]|uniref:Complex I NDUFA9 subunit family protein n=1 Tax=Pikeienuella piscinae TaxID=2748098 RepID=A0A7L5BUM6_9RHOB|nr:complex I NDUFA9 subunit family protein [Pikeienuella piscinae]QIE55535.1 complex I NDUFA9 subunit family protein [Pikeienuella piscinae]